MEDYLKPAALGMDVKRRALLFLALLGPNNYCKPNQEGAGDLF